MHVVPSANPGALWWSWLLPDPGPAARRRLPTVALCGKLLLEGRIHVLLAFVSQRLRLAKEGVLGCWKEPRPTNRLCISLMRPLAFRACF